MATSDDYRSVCFQHYDRECAECGASGDLQVHHKDRDRSNNEPENLVPLCKNCHWDEHRDEQSERASVSDGRRETYGKTDEFWEHMSELHSKHSGVEPSSNVRDVDWDIVEILREGRNNAPNIADRLGYTRQYIAERLVHLKTGDVVEPIGNGIYELVPSEVPEKDEQTD